MAGILRMSQHATLHAVKYICNHAELAAVACSTAVLGKMLEVLAECPTVRLLVSCSGNVFGTLQTVAAKHVFVWVRVDREARSWKCWPHRAPADELAGAMVAVE